MSAKDDKINDLVKQVESLSQQVADLKKLDLDAILDSSTSRRSRATDDSRPKKPKHEKPDWVASWNKRNASHGEVKTIVKTTETYHEKENKFEVKTELVDPIVKTSLKRDIDKDAANIFTGEETAFVEVVEEVGLPEHLQLNKLHDDRPSPAKWADRPTHDGRLDRSLPLREALKKLAANPGNPLEVRDEGPTKPVRKQMVRLNRVWKYRNFKQCANCEEYDTWEARFDPYSLDGVGIVHAEIWCQKCGATDFEVAENMPSHIGSWAPPKETTKEREMKTKRRIYREIRSLASLKESPKTTGELLVWFREVEQYSVVDMVMLDIMLRRMQQQGRVVLQDGKWQAL